MRLIHGFSFSLLLLGWCRARSFSDRLLFQCDFGDDYTQDDFCGMVQSQDDDIYWKLTRSSGKGDTGPLSDHTGNEGGTGKFLWAESSPSSGGRKASISTPLYNLTGDGGLLVFYYHMYGQRMGSLAVSVCRDGDPMWSLSGNQGNTWYQQNLTVSCGAQPARISFTATMHTEPSDIAIDDIFVYETLFTMTTAGQDEKSQSVAIGSSSKAMTTVTSVSQTHKLMETTQHSATHQGSDPALPVLLAVVVVLIAVVIILIVCLCHKRHQARVSKDDVDQNVHSDNNIVGTGGNETSVFNSSSSSSTTHQFAAGSVHYDTRVVKTRAARRLSGGDDTSVMNNTPVAPYEYIEDGMPTRGERTVRDGENLADYEAVTVKDDETGGYQFVDEPVVDSMETGNHCRSSYDSVDFQI